MTGPQILDSQLRIIQFHWLMICATKDLQGHVCLN